MNQEQAKEWLPIIQALAEGKTLQRVISDGTTWSDINEGMPFQFGLPASCYRIKPELKKGWYRVALFVNGLERFYPCTASSESLESSFQSHKDFVRWLTDRVEYELPDDPSLMCDKFGFPAHSKGQLRANLEGE